MFKINKRIEIVSSTSNGLSSMGKASREAVFAILSKHYTEVTITIVNDMLDLEALVARRPDLVFLGMKFIPVTPSLGTEDPRKIWLSEYFDDHDITYTGSSQVSHELELNKQLAKQRVSDAGLRTAAYHVVKQGQDLNQPDITLAYPLFVKPTNRGGGAGIDSASVVYDFKQLRSKIQSIADDLQADALIEEYLPGREFSVAILLDKYSGRYSVMPIELIAPLDEGGARLLSAKVKSADSENFLEVTDPTIRAKISGLAINVFHALEARDYGRVDIRLDAHGVAHFLEANLLPSLVKDYGNFPKACLLNINLEHEDMVLAIVRLAMMREVTIDEDVTDLSIVKVNVLPLLEPV